VFSAFLEITNFSPIVRPNLRGKLTCWASAESGLKRMPSAKQNWRWSATI